MRVMLSNNCGWFTHCLARETGTIGHLYSPTGQRGPWPWLPYAFDNGAFSCWDQKSNSFNNQKWIEILPEWHRLLEWGQKKKQKPLWAIVPDVPGNSSETLSRWSCYVGFVIEKKIPTALAVQDGMTVEDVETLVPVPDVIAVGGSTDFKWGTVEEWARRFSRVHVLRVNQPAKLDYLKKLGVESCDGTGWVRGDLKQTLGLERWARQQNGASYERFELAEYTCGRNPDGKLRQLAFSYE